MSFTTEQNREKKTYIKTKFNVDNMHKIYIKVKITITDKNNLFMYKSGGPFHYCFT